VKLMRLTGRPVDQAVLEAYEADFKVGFDAAMRKHAQPGQEDVADTMQLKAVDMLSVQTELQALDKDLLTKYKVTEEVEMPKTLKAWKALLARVEAPLMLAQSSENPKELVLVIVDRPLQD